MLKYGKFIAVLFETFKGWKGPNGEKFGNKLMAELLMGRLSRALTAELLATEKLRQLASPTTPSGYVLDAEDLKTLDLILAKYPEPDPKPISEVPIPILK